MAVRAAEEGHPAPGKARWFATSLRSQLTRVEGEHVDREMPGLLIAMVTTGIAGLAAIAVVPRFANSEFATPVPVALTGLLVLFIGLRILLVETLRGAWLCLLGGIGASLVTPFSLTSASPFEPHHNATTVLGLAVSFLLLVAGVYLLGRSVGMTVGGWLDGLLAAAGFASLATLAALATPRDLRHAMQLGLAESVTAQSLLCGSILALAAAAGWRRQGVWITLFVGQLLSMALHITPYFVTSFAPNQSAAFNRLGWFVSLAFIMLAAYCADPHAEAKPNARRAALSAAILPLVGLIATAAVLTMLVFRAQQDDTAALFPALAAAALATLRISQAIRGAEEFRVLSNIATTDELTGLANRRQLYHTIENVLVRHSDSSHGLLLLDLNAFKEVNDSLGHPVGDALLVRLGQRLSDCLPEGAMLARLGGDEFAVLLPFATPSAPGAVANSIRTALRAPFIIQGVRLQVGCSIGSARYPVDGLNAIELLSRADIAMYNAKRAAKGYQMYLPELESDTLNRLELLADLDEALNRNEFEVVFQPKMEVGTGRIVSAEALVRWRHPERGLLTPDFFLELVEQTGALPALTSIVLDQALDAAATWHRAGFDISVAVNVGSGDLLDDQLVDGLLERLARLGMPPRMCIIEVTEGAFIEADPSERIVRRLHNSGIPVAIDDYGAGYSSLSRLRALQANQLKLDRSLIASMTDDPGAAAVVKSSIQLAHALQMRLVAEGVEDVGTLQMLTDLGCDEIQGYLIARPMPAADLMSWLYERAAVLVA